MSRARRKRDASPTARRPMLLGLVFGVFLVLVGVTASGLVAITSAHLKSTALNGTVSRDASLVELFVNGNIRTADLAAGGPGAGRVAELGTELGALTRGDEILRVEVRLPNGLVRFASDPGVVGLRPTLSEAMRAALAGTPSASLVRAGESADVAGSALDATSLMQEFLPIVEQGGTTLAVVAIWRDATPLLVSLARAERDVLIVVIGAAAVLAAILFVVFGAAQARLSRQQRQLIEASSRDALTGLLNHGAVVAILADTVEAMRATGSRVVVAMLDVDNFKLFNESHGHQAGDEVLLRVARVAASETTDAAHLARYGPDEFLLIWLGLASADVQDRLGRLRTDLAGVSVQFGGSERLPVSISAGIAAFPDHARSVTELLSAVTMAVTEAKSSGGDAVRVALSEEERPVSTSFDVLQGLVIAVDTKDHYTKRHSEDVARYAVFLAKRLGLDDEVIGTIQLAGLLHDIGKIGIPDTLLRKPSKLTADEFDAFKQHVALGDAIVRDVPNVELVRAGIRHHHERWDGRGYLEGLTGEEIPLIGRIMAVADAFSAMTTTRPYRKALAVGEALKRLGDAAGTQLQEDLVATFITGIETAPDAPLPGIETPRIWHPELRVA